MEYIVALCQFCWIALLQSADLARKGTLLLFQRIREICPGSYSERWKVVFRIEEVLDGGTNLRQDTINDMDHPICGDLVPVDDSSAVHSDNLQSFENKKSDPVLIAKPPGWFPHPNIPASTM